MNTRPRRGSAKQVLVVTLGCIFVLGGFFALSQLGPRKYESAARRANISKEQAERLRETAEAAEERWKALKLKRTQEKTPFTEDDLRVIGEAAVARFQYENQVDGAEERYRDLKKELHDRSGELMRAESVKLENLAVIEVREKHYPQAEKLFRDALAIEERIGTDFPESSAKNVQRTVFLQSQARLMFAKPLWERSNAAEKRGEAAYAAGDLPGAIAAIDASRADNYTLERDYRGLTPADSFRTRALERRLATFRSITVRDRANALLDAIEKAAAARDFAKLPGLRGDIEAAARELREKYPESEYAAPAYVDGLGRRAQNAASSPEAETVERDLAAFEEAVRRGDTAASGMIENLQRGVQRVREMYPLADRVGKELADRIAYLFEHRTEIAVVDAVVKKALAPVPGRPTTLALRTETPQRLYALVMDDNPSATKGDNRPVESLTLAEATLFCKRLGWMLARPVHLPDEGEFLALAGKPDAAALTESARTLENSDGQPAAIPAAKADASGFSDLYGNVGEWLTPPAGTVNGEGFVAGGDAETSRSQLARTPVRRMITTERSRFTGFRFLVETGPAR